MCTTSCLEKINELKRQSNSDNHFRQLVRTEFSRKSVIGNWGNKRTYIVHDVDFDETVTSRMINYNGEEISVARYFDIAYKM